MILNLKEASWCPQINNLAKRPTPNMEQWLTKPHVLGDALAQAHGEIQVQVLSQTFQSAFEHELTYLQNVGKGTPFFIREIYLKNADQVLTYGRVTIPDATFTNNKTKIVELKNKSFGKTILYSHPNYRRSEFEYAHIHHEGVDYWGRRSIFWLDADPLIVTEVYMTDLGTYPELSKKLGSRL